MELRNKRVLVVGLARSGRAVASRLVREGAVVTVTDRRAPSSFDVILHELMEQKIGLELGIHREETFLNQDLVVVSPGVPWDLPALEAAREHRVMVVPEVEAASWFFQGTLVGITGTNGKTTTATLLGKMLEASEFQTFVAGNIGVPLISAVELFSPDSMVVAELSSFQLEAIQTFHPQVAVLLNITENHLDRHHTFDAYVSAKAQIFRNQQAEDYAVLNADDPTVMGLAPAIASRKVFFSMEQDLPDGVLLSRGKILYRVGNLERTLLEQREIKLRGTFNVQNVMAACAAACVLGADFRALRAAVREFTGVEHRLEYVRTIGGVDFYNDSKATSVDAAAKALSTFDQGVRLILGGKDKGAPYTPLKPLLEGRMKSIYLIGSAAEKIAVDLEGADLRHAGDLATAVEMAFADAIPGDVVLLSPACASYDQFEDFEQRGRLFKEIVAQLAGAPAAQRAIARDRIAPTKESEPEAAVPAGIEAGFPTSDAQAPEPETLAASESPEKKPELGPEAEAASSIGLSPPTEPAYVYEVSGEDTPAIEEDHIPAEFDEEAGAVTVLRPLDHDSEPLSPYEVRPDSDEEENGSTGSPAEANGPASEAKKSSGEGGQPELFSRDYERSRLKKGT